MLKPSMMKAAKELLVDWRSVTSLLATLMLFYTLSSYLPVKIRMFARKLLSPISTYLKPTVTIIIEDIDTFGCANDLYDSAQLYFSTLCLSDGLTVRLFKPCSVGSSLPSFPDSHTMHDTFQGVPIKWTSHKQERSEPRRGSSLNLVIHEKHRNLVLDSYIRHICREAARLRSKSRQRKQYTNHRSNWLSCTFSNPSNFDTIALDPSLREEIRADLLWFVSQEDYYMSIGRVWKRGYLLYGPPGTGKTSLVAAIANLLDFDVYDLELTAVDTKHQLRHLLASTTPKSVIVIENIDRSLDLSDQMEKPIKEDQEEARNISYMLKSMDGLWSSCLSERLIIFTTSHPDLLDPSLLRPGRVDKKFEMGYCGAAAFRILVKNYLCLGEEEIDRKDTIAEIERLLGEVEVTPADLAEVFMGYHRDSADAALDKLVRELHQRIH